MPNLWWPSRQDAPEMGDASLAALLAGAEPAEGCTGALQPLADALAALTAGPASDELAGEAAALAEFHNRVVCQSLPVDHAIGGIVCPPLLSVRAAAAAAVAALSLGGFATAAFAGALPAPAQQFAHHTFGAPAARGTRTTGTHPSAAATPAGPDATGPRRPAMHRLGARQSTRHPQPAGGGLPQPGRCRRGASNVAAYCAAVPHPRASASHSSHPTGPRLPSDRAAGLTPPGRQPPTDRAADLPPHPARNWPTVLAPVGAAQGERCVRVADAARCERNPVERLRPHQKPGKPGAPLCTPGPNADH